MAYRTSKHRASVDAKLGVVKTKLSHANVAGVHGDLREYAMAAAIFLAHAEFENYFVEALDGLAQTYSQVAVDASGLPASLRAHLIVTKLALNATAEKIVTKCGEQDILHSVDRWFATTESTLLTGASPLCQFTGGDVYGDYTYPSIKNIERILRRIGVGDPRGMLNRQLRRDVVALLESIAGLRTQLAHSATMPGISLHDVIQRIDELQTFIEALDRVLYVQLSLSVSDADWQSHMC